MEPLPITHVGHSGTNLRTLAARADGAVADYPYRLSPQLAIPRTDANRDDLDVAGHRPADHTTELDAA